LKEFAQGVFNRVEANLAFLVDYGLNEESLQALKAAIDAYGVSIPKPRLSIAENKQATSLLTKLFEEGDIYLVKMDVLVEIVRTSHSGFYEGYKNARRLISVGVGSLALKGLVTDANTGEPLKGVKLSFAAVNTTGGGQTAAVLVKITASKGGLHLKTLAEGMYEVTASKNGYKPQVVQVAVNASETAELRIQLQKN
jgi:hypothetical protein